VQGTTPTSEARTTPTPEATSSQADHPPRPGVKATAFGLDVRSEITLAFLEGSTAKPTGRVLEISGADGDAAKLGWPEHAELVCEERQPDGSVIFRIEAHPEAGYLISGPQYGTILLSADGRRLQCASTGLPDAAWQRLLIAQALPFAALLRGLEIIHASAVVTERGAVAFVGPSRAGKTSLALELCRRGAGFLTDDVLALERVEEDLLGHPGTPVAGVDHAEAQRRERTEGRQRQEIVAVNSREQIVRMRGAPEPTPLAALFFLDRRRDAPNEPRFEPTTDPQPLFAATFNTVLTTPARLRGLLEVCALLARRRVERVAIGPGVDAARLAVAVEQRLGSPT
jgi:hypothetical protein